MLCQSSPSDQQSLSFYQRKLYALIQSLVPVPNPSHFSCLQASLSDLEIWWKQYGAQIQAIAKASDRLAFQPNSTEPSEQVEVRHLISGQSQTVAGTQPQVTIPAEILKHPEPQTVLLWLWRFHPELQVAQQQDALLFPAESFMPDCPHHSYASNVSALTGAMFSDDWQRSPDHQEYNPQPYLLLFTFSPVQEFIKASRKFLDFWAGSYLLHYLSADLCWLILQHSGPDMVITPSLWSQEIIDALILKQYPNWAGNFRAIQTGKTPLERFNERTSVSLSTAGFPNNITVLCSSKTAAVDLGKKLAERLKTRWQEISQNVKKAIKEQVRIMLNDGGKFRELMIEIQKEFELEDIELCRQELEHYRQPGCWEWNALWNAQIDHTWEPYYVAVPLGHPDSNCPLQIDRADATLETWIQAQNDVARPKTPIPSPAEREAYSTINVGTWWGSYQGRLGQLIQAVKNTRNWQISVAPGERSSLSGQYSAVHPRLNYGKFQNGRGMTATSMRLFWKVMKYAYPGVFNGSEKLNAIELTKRMAWKEGGVAAELGIKFDQEEEYENLIRFPNLSSIAAAKFASEHPERVQQYWTTLRSGIYNDLSLKAHHDRFCSLTRRPFQVKRADDALNQLPNVDKGYNGVMFSSKWLADDLGLQTQAELSALRDLVTKTHQKHNFGDSSPADWWVLVMGDGDGMGNYVSGGKLKPYREYVIQEAIDQSHFSTGNTDNLDALLNSRKRMGPATHVGLNRALLDCSNRLVPYLAEQRCCGRVIYSGGDDVMVMLPLADLPGFLRSLRAAWSGEADPEAEFQEKGSGYWHPPSSVPEGIPNRPLFTMGKDATMSLGVIIAHKSVPLPTVLESLWEAEKDRAKKMQGGVDGQGNSLPAKDGLCFRVIYGSGNTLEALMKGHLLESWWQMLCSYELDPSAAKDALAPVLYRLAEELPRHADVTANHQLCSLVAKVVLSSRDQTLPEATQAALTQWLDQWEAWAWAAQQTKKQELVNRGDSPEAAEKAAKTQTMGARPEDLGYLLRFTAFWVSRREQEKSWTGTATNSTGGSQ